MSPKILIVLLIIFYPIIIKRLKADKIAHFLTFQTKEINYSLLSNIK